MSSLLFIQITETDSVNRRRRLTEGRVYRAVGRGPLDGPLLFGLKAEFKDPLDRLDATRRSRIRPLVVDGTDMDSLGSYGTNFTGHREVTVNEYVAQAHITNEMLDITDETRLPRGLIV